MTSPGTSTDAEPDEARGRRTSLALLAAAMLAAIVPRALGLDFGLPLILHMDELEPVGRSRELLAFGELDDRMAWRYPPLVAELLAISQLLAPCEGCGDAPLLLRGRILSVIVSAAAAALLTDAGRRIGLAPWAALLAGLMFAWSPILVRLGRYTTPDALMTALVALVIWAGVRLIDDGRPRIYLAAGLGVGLAAAAKYNAALVAVVVVAAHLIARPRDARAWLWLVLAGVASVVGFALALAWPWADFETFRGGLEYEWKHYALGHDGFDCDNAGVETLGYVLRFAIGPVAGLVAILGVIAMIAMIAMDASTRRRLGDEATATRVRRAAWVVGLYVLAYLALLSRQHLFFARLAAPLIPALALLVAASAHVLVELALARVGPKAAPTLATLSLGLILLPPAIASARQTQAVRDVDTRLLAHRFIAEHLRDPSVRVVAHPRSAERLIPETIAFKSVYDGMTVRRMREIGATHVIYNQGSIERFRWRPQDNVEALAHWDAFDEQLRAHGRLLVRFEHAPLPGAERFGDSARTIHHSAVEIWALVDSSRQ